MFNISLKICVFIILQKVSAIFDSNSKRLQATNGGRLSNTSASSWLAPKQEQVGSLDGSKNETDYFSQNLKYQGKQSMPPFVPQLMLCKTNLTCFRCIIFYTYFLLQSAQPDRSIVNICQAN